MSLKRINIYFRKNSVCPLQEKFDISFDVSLEMAQDVLSAFKNKDKFLMINSGPAEEFPEGVSSYTIINTEDIFLVVLRDVPNKE